MLDGRTMRAWRKERDKVIRTYNVKAFRMFYEKWTEKGLYKLKLPNDLAIEVAMRKIVYNLPDATEKEKAEAKEWLTLRGYNTEY